jgi:hypothetical protein
MGQSGLLKVVAQLSRNSPSDEPRPSTIAVSQQDGNICRKDRSITGLIPVINSGKSEWQAGNLTACKSAAAENLVLVPSVTNASESKKVAAIKSALSTASDKIADNINTLPIDKKKANKSSNKTLGKRKIHETDSESEESASNASPLSLSPPVKYRDTEVPKPLRRKVQVGSRQSLPIITSCADILDLIFTNSLVLHGHAEACAKFIIANESEFFENLVIRLRSLDSPTSEACPTFSSPTFRYLSSSQGLPFKFDAALPPLDRVLIAFFSMIHPFLNVGRLLYKYARDCIPLFRAFLLYPTITLHQIRIFLLDSVIIASRYCPAYLCNVLTFQPKALDTRNSNFLGRLLAVSLCHMMERPESNSPNKFKVAQLSHVSQWISLVKSSIGNCTLDLISKSAFASCSKFEIFKSIQMCCSMLGSASEKFQLVSIILPNAATHEHGPMLLKSLGMHKDVVNCI